MSKILDSSILGFFKDPAASSILSLAGDQIVAPTIQGHALTDEEMQMGGGVRIVMYVLDRSPSMEDVEPLILADFGSEYIAAMKEARESDISALRLGGVSFSSEITQIWKSKGKGFHTLDELPKLTKAEFNTARGSGTALHQAILEAYNLALQYAAEIVKDTGMQPEIDIIVLSDGVNNCSPIDPDVIKKLIKGSKKDLVRWVYFYFETSPGTDPEELAKSMGFDEENTKSFALIPGETSAERKKRFRLMMNVMSRVSASKGMSAVNAAAAAAAAPAPAGGDPDEVL